MSEKVQGRCPFCGHDSLFLGSGGYITCSVRECPNPTAITDLLDGETEHVVELREGDFTIKHPLRERWAGDLFNCSLHQHLASLDGPPSVAGRYRVRWSPSQKRTTWEPIK
jgi:hypothetical protein